MLRLRHTAKRVRFGMMVLLFLAANGMVEAQIPKATADQPFEGVNWRVLSKLDLMLRMDAELNSRHIAGIYEATNRESFPGIHQLGGQILAALNSRHRPLDFQTLVSRNSVFWQAERELSLVDSSFPYLVAMIAILSDERATAARLIAMSQASLPLPPMIRRYYAHPEAILLQLDYMYQNGILERGEKFSADNYKEKKAILAARLERWPQSTGLWQYVVELEVAKAKSDARSQVNPEILSRAIRQGLGLSLADSRSARGYDFIMGSALDNTVREWLEGKVVAQRWIRWVKYSDPAEADDVARSVALFEKDGRLDLAWLFWRHEMVLNLLVSEKERDHWKLWCRELLGERAARELERKLEENPHAGSALVPVDFSEQSEAWSGDLGVHPLIVVKTERKLALLDTQLRMVQEGSLTSAWLHLSRARALFDIASAEGMMRELSIAGPILGSDDIALNEVQAKLGLLEGNYTIARDFYARNVANKDNDPARKDYASILYMSGDYQAAHEQYLKVIPSLPQNGHMPLMADLTARRMGGRSVELLEVAQSQFKEDLWVSAGISYALNEITEEELLIRARKGPLFEIIQHECEAWFWISQMKLAAGDRAGGLQALHRCVSTGFTSFIEYKIAKAELKRFEDAQQNDGPDEKSHRNSRGAIAA